MIKNIPKHKINVSLTGCRRADGKVHLPYGHQLRNPQKLRSSSKSVTKIDS